MVGHYGRQRRYSVGYRNGRGRGRHQPLRIREFVLAYLAGLTAWLGSLALSVVVVFPISPLVYLIVGYFLTRFVTRRFDRGPLSWNWHIASLADVARAKFSTFLAWPVALPVLIWQLMLFKFL